MMFDKQHIIGTQIILAWVKQFSHANLFIPIPYVMNKINISFNIALESITSWIPYIQEIFAKEMLESPLIDQVEFMRVKAEAQEGYRLFAFQLTSSKEINLKQWQRKIWPEYRAEFSKQFGEDKILTHLSYLETIDLHL